MGSRAEENSIGGGNTIAIGHVQYYYWAPFGCLGNTASTSGAIVLQSYCFPEIVAIRANNVFKTIILCFKNANSKINLFA